MHSRTRQVLEIPAHGGYQCPELSEIRHYNEQPCPIDCVVSAFTRWTVCSKTCGDGTTTRTRKVTKKTAFGGKVCPVLAQSKSCNSQACPIDCVVSSWAAWSSCSLSCGTGTHGRSRTVEIPAAH